MKVPRQSLPQTISLGDRQSHRLRFIMSAVAAIGCDELDAELVRTKGALDNWASNVVSAADQLRDSHKRNIFELKSDIEVLTQRKQELSSEAERLRQRLSVESSKEEALQAELSLVQAEEAALPLKITKLQEALSLETGKLHRREAAVLEEEKVRHRKISQLRHSLDTFRNRLGLYFRQAPGEELQIVFDNVDPQDHKRQFAFAVKIQEGKKYAVTSCEPPVQALEDLLHSLNKGTIVFSTFVQTMRRQFQHLCQ